VLSVLQRAVREVKTALGNGRVTESIRTKFQAVALMLRDERARVRADESLGETKRAEQLKRLDDVATSLAMSAVRDSRLMVLLSEDAVVSDEARALERDMLRKAGVEVEPEPEPEPE
jgi:hypothetical protein